MSIDDNLETKGYLKWFLSWRGVVLTIVLLAISYSFVRYCSFFSFWHGP
jgi:hypothetical protein